MNGWISTPSMLKNKHGYSQVETSKYFNAFTRSADDPLAPGFKFAYWGQSKFNHEDSRLKPLRTCVGEVGPKTRLTYVSPATESYAKTVRSPRSKSNPRGRKKRMSGSAVRRSGRSASPSSPGRFAGDTVASRSRALAAAEARGEVYSDDEDVEMAGTPKSGEEHPLSKSVQVLRVANASAENKLGLERLARKRAEKALDVERESRRVLLAECAEERQARLKLEAGLSNASVALERARARIRALATQNQTLRRENSSHLVDEANERWQRAVAELEEAARVKADLREELRKERDLRHNLQDLLAEAEASRAAAQESAELADVARELAETARSKAQHEAAMHKEDKDKLSDRLSTAIDRIEALERRIVDTAHSTPRHSSPRRRPKGKSASPSHSVSPTASPYFGYMPSGFCSKTPSPPTVSRALAASPSSITSKSSRASKGRSKAKSVRSKKSSKKSKDPNPVVKVGMRNVADDVDAHPLMFL